VAACALVESSDALAILAKPRELDCNFRRQLPRAVRPWVRWPSGKWISPKPQCSIPLQEALRGYEPFAVIASSGQLMRVRSKRISIWILWIGSSGWQGRKFRLLAPSLSFQSSCTVMATQTRPTQSLLTSQRQQQRALRRLSV